MSRYYDLALYAPGSATPYRRWTSHPNGIFDPGALNIEFDAFISQYGTPTGASTVHVHGVPLQDLGQAQQFAGMMLILKGGMAAPGLPLINPSQAGIILKGQVFQTFGNWQGTDMTLDFVVIPSEYTNENPGNIVLSWGAGTQLSQALAQTFSIAYPGTQVAFNISENLVQSHDEIHFCATLDQLGETIANITQDNLGNKVNIGIQAGKILVYDTTYAPTPIQLNFTDFIGQPTWIDVNQIQIQMVLRADLRPGAIIKMPQGLQNAPGVITATYASRPSSIKYQTTFQNNFTVGELRQVGNFRSSDAAAWVTIANCYVIQKTPSVTVGAPTVVGPA
jgi:hypothetical protein